jgi:hypothetical protein
MAAMIGRTKSWLAWLAGSVLALVFGSAGCGKDERPVAKYGPPPVPPAGKPDKPTGSLEESREWKQVVSAWAGAEKLLAKPKQWDGKKEVKPDEEPKKSVRAGLETAKANIAALLGAGLLTAAEAEFLTQGLGQLSTGVAAWGGPIMLCYVIVPLSMERASARRLAERQPLIEKLAAQGKISPAVADKIRASTKLLGIEGDLATLSSAEKWKDMPADEREKTIKTREAAKAQVRKLKKLLDAKPPEERK